MKILLLVFFFTSTAMANCDFFNSIEKACVHQVAEIKGQYATRLIRFARPSHYLGKRPAVILLQALSFR